MIHDLAAFVDSTEARELSPVPEEACTEFKKRLLASPGKKNAWAQDAVMDTSIDFFRDVWNCVAGASRPLFCELNLYDDMPDRQIRREEQRSSSEDDLIDIVTSTTKRLLDQAWDLSTGQVRKHRIQKGLQAYRLLGSIKSYGPLEWSRMMPLLRKTLFDTSVPKDLKKTKLTGLHALLSLCVETALNRPIVPLEETIVDSLKPSVVFANDRSDAPIVYDSLQQDLDFLSMAFSSQTHALAAFTKSWNVCLEAMKESNLKVPTMKKQFERCDVKSPKDHTTMWRNFLTELTWSWAFVRNVVELFKSKNFKEAQKTLNEWYAFCMNEGLSESLNVLAKHKLIPAKAVPELVRLADIVVNVAFAFVTQAENFFKTKGLREKFYLMDYLTVVFTCENPQATPTAWSHNGCVITELPYRWTLLKIGFESLEGSDLEISWRHTRNQTRLALSLFQDLSFMWNLWTDTSFWTRPVKVLHGSSVIQASVLDTLPTGRTSILESWMESSEERLSMKKSYEKAYKAAEDLLIQQWASMI